MKNLFKNLMLVAVAAMAFTACQKDNEDVNRVNETTVVEFKAEFDTTRSGFNEKDGEGYSSHWDGGEAINLEVVSTAGVASPLANPTMEADGTFKAELNGSISNEGTITALIPAASWKNEYNYEISGYEMVPSIPLVQTPEAGSVDPAAHILKAEKAFEGGLGGVQTLTFAHQVAYAKMTLELGSVVAFENIAQVAVEIDAQRYTLLPTNLTEPTFWFACKEATPAAMTVTITAENGSNYVKELDLANAVKPLDFTTGCVASFTVGGFTESVIPDVKSISASYNEWNNTFSFSVTEKNGGELFLTGIQFKEAITSGMLPESDELDLQYDSEKVYWTDAKGSMKWIRSLFIAVNQEAEGYTIAFAWSTDETNEVPAEYDYYSEGDGLVYTGIIEGINNPPVPEAATVTTAPESVSGRATSDAYDYTYYLSFVAGDWTISDLYFYAPVASNGIIPEGEHTIKGGTATLTDTTWAFAITEGTLTVAYSDEDYVLTFAFEDANGSTYNFSYTGVIEGESGIFQPGAATPLVAPSNVAYELVDFTKARITWDAVDGAGSYELYYQYWDNTLGKNVDSDPVTTENNYYVFEDFTAGNYYTVYVKSLPADETKNTASENYSSVYNVQVFADPNSMETTYEFNTAANTGNNKIKFSNGVNSAVIAFPQSLENIAAGTYDANNIYPYDCKVNGASINTIEYVVVEGTPGEEQTVTMVISVNYGEPSIKAVFTGVIDMEVAPLEYTYATVAFDGTSLSYNFSGDGVGLYFLYFANGANGIEAGEYTFTSNVEYSGYYTYTWAYDYMTTIDLKVTGNIGEEQTYEFVLHTEYNGDIKAVYTGVLMAE